MNDCKKPPMPCIPPDKPSFCPKPMPPMPPFMPPEPSVVEGKSLYEAFNILNGRVNTMCETYNDVMRNCYETLGNLYRAAEENGAYYNKCEVYTEDGYDADQGATYKLTHKAVVDRHNNPIRIEMHLAYGNTTNSKIEQKLNSASMVELADKIFIAQPISEDGWYGVNIYKGAPIPTSDANQLFTVGFTKRGIMRVYNNTVTADQLLNDTVENSMGCSGVVIQNGQLCDENWTKGIPNRDIQTSRILMGQNINTGEVIWLTCDSTDNVSHKGMTTAAAAKILLQYGCSIAVELAEGTNAGAMDKGQMLIPTTDGSMPKAYAFWYISRRCEYRNDYQRELAELTQNYNYVVWQEQANELQIEAARAEIAQEVEDRKKADEQLQENIDAEETARKEADTTLQDNIEAEEQARQAEDAKLQAAIDAEAQTRLAEDTKLSQAIQNEVTQRQIQDEALSNRIVALNTRVTRNEESIAGLTEITTNLNQTVTQLNNRVTTIETGYTEISNSMVELTKQVNDVKNTLTLIEAGTTDLPYVKDTNGVATGYIQVNQSTASGVATVGTQYHNDNFTRGVRLKSASAGNTIEVIEGATTSNVTLTPTATDGTRLGGVATPIADNDVATKKYVDEAAGQVPVDPNKMDKNNGVGTGNTSLENLTVSGDTTLDMVNAQTVSISDSITVPTPVGDTNAATKKYVDDTARTIAENEVAEALEDLETSTTSLPYIAKDNGQGTGTTVLENLQVTGNTTVATPTVSMQAANKKYVDDVAAGLIPSGKYLEVAGGAMEGNISMDTHKISNLGTPTNDADAATKVYVDEQVAAQSPAGKYLPLTGGTMQGDIILGSNSILGNAGSGMDISFNNTDKKILLHTVAKGGGNQHTVVIRDANDKSGGTITNLSLPDEDNGATPKKYVDALIPTVTALTMSASGWSNGSYSFETAYPFENYNIQIELAGTATDAQITAWGDAKILGNATANTAIAKGTVPTVDLPIILTAIPKKYVG